MRGVGGGGGAGCHAARARLGCVAEGAHASERGPVRLAAAVEGGGPTEVRRAAATAA